ncbi:MAG: SGNH/GDSL hydrolase family protein [Proteobacteria bacterium]|nr:SGNH/GDSL hydrolase family protein [Pseudomonadota bacterium]
MTLRLLSLSPSLTRSHPHTSNRPGVIYAILFSSLSWLGIASAALGAETPAELKLTGDWEVKVSVSGARTAEAVVVVAPPKVLTVSAEKYDSLPVFNPKAGGWIRGAQLRPLRAQETTTAGLLDPDSLVLRAGPEADAATFRKGTDYEADLAWGTVGRLATGGIKEGQPVYASYRHVLLRLDTIVVTRDGRIELRQGEPRAAAPAPPSVGPGERHLANVWLPGRIAKLASEHLFPVLETAYPEPAKPSPSLAELRVPKALKKLRTGEPLRLLAWGDSVTVGTYVPDPAKERWQEQFVARLRERFPQAKIELITEAWGGRNTGSYLNEPPGSLHNYREKVLGAKPDLVVSEFVNDAGLSPAAVEERYSKLLADFQGLGAEWIILTPHYVRPDWMGLNREREIDNDPRPYVAGMRAFAAKHEVALADASLRYGRLWRQGIPYNTLMLNSINHPDPRGMKIFADALMELFP